MGRSAGWLPATTACAINSVTINSKRIGCSLLAAAACGLQAGWLHAGPLLSDVASVSD